MLLVYPFPSSLYPLAYSSDSGGSDSEGGSVSRRKKKISRDKDKSRKSKKEKDEEKRKGVNITCIMYIFVCTSIHMCIGNGKTI